MLININLTTSRYHLPMQKPAQNRTGKKTGFWFALAIALTLHAAILLLPMAEQAPGKISPSTQIELQLTTIHTQAPVPQGPEQVPEELFKEPITEPEPLPETEIAEPKPPEQKTQLTSAVLMRQFISKESATDRIFGRPLDPQATEPQKEFHYPARQNMITMLAKPLPDLPFAYTPDLIYFAYDPGVRGDLQRLWDVITPEFGWRTDNGTEFKCKWILIIEACGWK